MRFEEFWYIAAEARDLHPGAVLGRQVLGEWLVLFRDDRGSAVALRDRCMHRAGRLSQGSAVGGCVRCPYHGWTYDGTGQVVAVPSEGSGYRASQARRTVCYATRERDGLVFVRLAADGPEGIEPFPMPHWGAKGWATVRLVNRFDNNVTNCVENFIDVPHTVSVHPGIFRQARGQEIRATVERSAGRVHVVYHGETDNLGWFSWFLNPRREPLLHTDTFHMPNVTQVIYTFPNGWSYVITSQSVPETDEQTLVYTDLTWNFGAFTALARPTVRWMGQRVIDQDVLALRSQMESIRKYGDQFANTAADSIHVLVESIRDEIAQGGNPEGLADKRVEVRFFV